VRIGNRWKNLFCMIVGAEPRQLPPRLGIEVESGRRYVND
jgi:hypothetical protein